MVCPDHQSVLTCSDKSKAHEAITRIKVPTPELYQDIDSVGFPCMVKPRFGRGSSGVYRADNKKDLDLYLDKVNEPVVQEFIKGEEYTVDVLADKDGNALSVVPRVRIQTESGIAVKAKTVHNEDMIGHCRRITKELKIFGPSCIQFIENEDGPKFIEVNTRFGGGSILSIKADPTIVPNLIRMIKGECTTESKGFTEGLIMLRYHSEVFVPEDRISMEGKG